MKILIIFETMLNSQPIWAQNFLSKVSNSSMGLNLTEVNLLNIIVAIDWLN